MATQIKVLAVLPAGPLRIYQALLNAVEQKAVTGAEASIEPWPGGRFSTWDGYVTGSYVALEPSKRIVQSWRHGDFGPGDPDSRVEVLLEPVEGGTRVTVHQSGVPESLGASLELQWRVYFLGPMRAYFKAETPRAGAAAARRAIRRAKTGPHPSAVRPAPKTPSETMVEEEAAVRPAKKKPAEKKPAS